jgi:hypothetical protein
MSADAVTLRDGAGNPVASSVSYDPGSRTVSLTPSSPLLPSSSYTATLGGGAGGLSDLAGNPLASDVTWSFTTEAVDTTAPVVIARSPAPGETGVSVLTAIAAGFDEGLDEASVNSATVALRDAEGNIVSTDVTYIAASREIRAVPLAALSPSRSYTVTLRGGTAGDRITDLAGNALSSDISWSFTTAEPAGCPCGIWDDTAVPGTPSVSDPNAVELGMKFVASVDGFATGVRFYKGAGNTGTHVGRLWTEDGALLAEVTFTAETATGWQQASFATPVALAADTVYVVSYLAPNGGYAADSGYFSGTSVTNGPLRALQDGESGGNGVYRYGAGGGFPSQTWQASNYWVDVVFRE